MRIDSKLNPRDPQFQDNTRAMQALVDDLREQLAKSALGGGETARRRHVSRRNGNLGVGRHAPAFWRGEVRRRFGRRPIGKRVLSDSYRYGLPGLRA